ncbi:MAG: sigma-70 family RNA polymerase sigma factor [Planctomycetaceae bacterium]|nr:sigma-70 family RNA polymerase sigma factor [Planctomycetaceae bacterium]
MEIGNNGPLAGLNIFGNAALDIGQLVAEHYEFVYRAAYRLTGSATDAEDVAQQTFLAAHRNLAQLREAAAARGWLAAILRNCFWKACRRRQPLSAEAIEFDLDGVAAVVPEESIVDSERLQLALNRLSAEARVILTMFYFEQLSYVEIAAQLEIPLGTVMSRLARAKRRLRELLFSEVSDDERPPTTALEKSPTTSLKAW